MTAHPEIKPARVAHKTLASALACAQMQMGPALKSSVNPAFKGEGKPKGAPYADLASVCDACLPALNANGIAVVQPFYDDETGRYVKTVLIHGESGETLECRVPLIVSKNDMQGFGSAATYARRYGLMSMAGIAPEDDDGNAAVAAAPKRQDRREPAQPDPVGIATDSLRNAETLEQLAAIWGDLPNSVKSSPAVIEAKDSRKNALSKPANADLDDEIPY